MAEGKKSFQVYTEWIEVFEALNDEDAGQLIKHIFNYVNDKKPVAKNLLVKLSFIQIKQQLKRDLKKWEVRAQASKANGALGGRPKNLLGSLGNLEEPRKPVKVKVKDKVKVKVKEEVKEKVSIKANKFATPQFEEIKSYFFEKLQSSEQSNFEAEKFIDFYSSKGWMVGRNKMKDWKASVRNWIKGIKTQKNESGDKFSEEAIRTRMEGW